MPIKYRCSNCHQVLSVSRRQSGKQFPCPRCGAPTRVPEIPAELRGKSEDPSDPRLAAIQEPIAEPKSGSVSEKPSSSPPPIPQDQLREPQQNVEAATESIDGQKGPHETEHADGHKPHSQMVMSAEVGPFKFKKRLSDDDGMDLTPMVDVTFLLLIFFMITASFSMQKTMEFPKPNPQDKGARQTLTIENLENDSIMIKIDEHNGITVDETPLAEPALLAEQLTQLRYSTRRTSVAIDAHKDAYHETVVTVIDASNAAGMENIKLISRTGKK